MILKIHTETFLALISDLNEAPNSANDFTIIYYMYLSKYFNSMKVSCFFTNKEKECIMLLRSKRQIIDFYIVHKV